MRTGIEAVAIVFGLMAYTEAGADKTAEQMPEGAAIEPGGSENAGLVADDAIGSDAVEVRADGADVRFDPSCLIATESVAGIAMPDTLGDFVSAFADSTVLSFYPTYMVDFGKLCLRADGEDALCADFESYNVEIYHPDIDVAGMSVYAPQCRTAADVGPGSPVSAAVAAYGSPTFGFNYENEGREYVIFADQPDSLSFRARSTKAEANTGSPGSPNGPYAGIYDGVPGDGSYFESSDFYSDGVIWEVFISAPMQPSE